MFKIVERRALNPTVTKLVIHAPLIAKKAQPGQFIIVRPFEDSERIPLTVADYDRENGTITIDVETLYDVARALDIDLKCFIDYQPPVFHAQSVLPKNFYFNQPRAYMYYYDGRVRQLVRSLLCFSPSASGEGIDVMMYVGVDNFREPDRCQHLFTGEMKPYDTITHMVLTNQINEAEKMYICMLNPMHNRTPTVGLLSGIGSTPFFARLGTRK